jgi:hypothetical protein
MIRPFPCASGYPIDQATTNRQPREDFIHPVHISRKLRWWVEGHQAEIRLIYLPPYSPD